MNLRNTPRSVTDTLHVSVAGFQKGIPFLSCWKNQNFRWKSTTTKKLFLFIEMTWLAGSIDLLYHRLLKKKQNKTNLLLNNGGRRLSHGRHRRLTPTEPCDVLRLPPEILFFLNHSTASFFISLLYLKSIWWELPFEKKLDYFVLNKHTVELVIVNWLN